MRILAVDFGSKRIGFAVGEAEFGIASPRAAVDSKQGLKINVETILEMMARESADAVAVGIPLLPGQEESATTRVCRQLAQMIRERGKTVFEVDESLTSLEADDRLRGHDWTAAQRDRHKDSEAACLILERFFAEHGQEKP